MEHQNGSEHLHRQLMSYSQTRLIPSRPENGYHWESEIKLNMKLARMEMEFIEAERLKVAEQAHQVPQDSKKFIEWFESLKQIGPGQGDPLFPWLAESATLEQMRWFIKQEVAGEAGFEDLLAMTQLRMPVNAKLEMARNFWDEMGRGAQQGMHSPMLENTAKELDIVSLQSDNVWEALALSNIMVGLAFNRRYAYHSIGSLGVVELTAPTRASYVANGLKRLNASKQGSLYFSLHATIDVRHSIDWNCEVITSLLDQDPSVARYIAEGALMRLNAGARCFERYRKEFDLV